MKYPKLNIEVYLDGANRDDMLARQAEGFVKGFTTNPTLMAKAGIKDYQGFAQNLLGEIRDLPVSFEVFSDEFPEMERQAKIIHSWGKNVYVKVPITNTKGAPAYDLVRKLLDQGIRPNVTAIFTRHQLNNLREIMKTDDDVIISIFAGRVADTGVDPIPLMKEAVQMFASFPKARILWASPREVLNIYQAAECGCHIITATNDLIAKLPLHTKTGEEFSLETVKMFYDDGKKAGFQL